LDAYCEAFHTFATFYVDEMGIQATGPTRETKALEAGKRQ